MKKIMTITALTFLALTFKANAQDNIINQYGAPTFTGGDVPSPNQFGPDQEQAQQGLTLISTVFPNPSRGATVVVLQDMPIQKVQLYVVDLNGTIVRSRLYNPGNNKLAVNVESLPQGLYSIEVQEEGKEMQSTKLLKDE